MAMKGREGHIPSALSILDIVYVYYNRIHDDSSLFVLSKGHGCLALYVVLKELGIMTAEFMEWPAMGHPERCPEQGIEVSTGSLGHGLPMAVGMALARPEKKVYVLMGDRELEEGTTWECGNVIDRFEIENLCVIVDGNSKMGMFEDGIGGHNHDDIEASLREKNKVFAITTKGRGILQMESEPEKWHHRVPTKEEYENEFTFRD
jgi:transketolase